MTNKKPEFWYSMLRDDDGDFCLCRFLLLLSPVFGLATMCIYCYFFKNAATDTNMWDAFIACSGMLGPVITFCVMRIYESREWIAEQAKKWKKS